MKSMLQIAGLMYFFIFSAHNLMAQTDEECQLLHQGTFKYGNTKDKIKVVINGNEHIEYYDKGKYYIKSELNWINQCSYVMTMVEITLPNFPYKSGDQMTVQVTKVEKKKIYYTASVNGRNWSGLLIKKK